MAGISRRTLLHSAIGGGLSLSALPAYARPRQRKPLPQPIIDVKRDFGAKGDGVSNDTEMFAAAGREIKKRGGGTVFIPTGVYVVGDQLKRDSVGMNTASDGRFWVHQPILKIESCTKAVAIIGEGTDKTILRARDGLRFGAFDPATGEVYAHDEPLLDVRYRADAYVGMLEVRNNSSVRISDIHLDGNAYKIMRGGTISDMPNDWQCMAYGIYAQGNHEVLISNVYTHDHGTDGVTIACNTGEAAKLHPHTLQHVRCDRNARHGMSWIGQSGLKAFDCSFSRSGQGAFKVRGGCGVDLEPDCDMSEGYFKRCMFEDNIGNGVSAEGKGSNKADLRDVTFDACTFYATRTEINGSRINAIYVRRPGMTFRGCHITGVVNAGMLPATSLPHVFEDCDFVDAPSVPRDSSERMIDAAYGDAVILKNCRFVAIMRAPLHLTGGTLECCRFDVRLSKDAKLQEWLISISFSKVRNCVFIDNIVEPWEGPPKLGIVYTRELWKDNEIRSPKNRIVPSPG